MTSDRCRDVGGTRTMRGMDAMSMVLIAIGSLACLELAAVNLRGDARRPRKARALRPRR